MFFQDVISLIDKSITMKTIITFTFLLFSFLGFSQTTREEIMLRNEYGQKSVVNTYSGTGNGEKLLKTTYYTNNNLYMPELMKSLNSPISIKPNIIEYFGKFKEQVTFTKDYPPYKLGDVIEYQSYGVIKRETYYTDGTLYNTWKIEETSVESNYFTPFTRKYTLIP